MAKRKKRTLKVKKAESARESIHRVCRPMSPKLRRELNGNGISKD